MKHQTPDSMKFRKLARRLGLRLYEAVGVLELLWLFAVANAPDGNLTEFSPHQIGDWMEWPRDPGELVAAMVETGWLELNDAGMVVADWETICRDYQEPIGRRRDLSTAAWRRLRQQVAAEDGTICVYCGCDCGSRFTVDHVVPVARGGSMDRENLVIACRTCNGRKGDR